MSKVDLQQLAVRRDDSQSKVELRRHLLTRYVLPLALLAGLLGLLAWGTRDWYWPGEAVTVMPVLTTRSPIQQTGKPLFKAAGWVEPRPTPVRVSALASGVVEKLLVVEDQHVVAGEPIAYLIKEDAQLALKASQATLALRQAEVDQAKAQLRAAKTNLEQPVHLQAEVADAQASLARVEAALAQLPFDLRQAEARLRFAQQDLRGKQRASGVVSGVSIDQARSEQETARAKVEDLRKRRSSLEQERQALEERQQALQKKWQLKTEEHKAYGEAQARLQAAQARVQSAKVAVAQAQLRLDRMTVRAPLGGRVLHLVAHPGSHVASGGGHMAKADPSTVITLYQPGRLQLRVDVRFDDLPGVQRDQAVTISSAALSSPLSGKVLFLSSQADIQKNTLEVKVQIDDPPAILKPEMLMDVTFLAPEQEAPAPTEQLRLLVPKQLIQKDQDGAFVWLARISAGLAHRQRVELGPERPDGLVEVVKGLQLSSRLIVKGRERVRQGSRIRIVGEGTSGME